MRGWGRAQPTVDRITDSDGCTGSSHGIGSARSPPLAGRPHGGGPSTVGDPITLARPVGTDRVRRLRGRARDGRRRVERREVADDPAGSEFDGAWSPDGDWVVYRDSTRGINDDDEIFIARADGSDRRNLTKDPANDWGPDWSPDGRTIAFNSDRDGGRLRGYLVDPDGSNLRLLDIEGWVEYPSFSPDGTRITYMGHDRGDYDIYVADLATGATEQLTDSPGNDGWPVWSPDGSTIAFTSERDDCAFAPADEECWREAGPDDQHRDVWLMDADGSTPVGCHRKSGSSWPGRPTAATC